MFKKTDDQKKLNLTCASCGGLMINPNQERIKMTILLAKYKQHHFFVVPEKQLSFAFANK